MKAAELEAIKSEQIDKLADLFVEKVEIESCKLIEDEEPQTLSVMREANPEMAKAIRAAAEQVYEQLGFDPFYKFIVVEHDLPEEKDEGQNA